MRLQLHHPARTTALALLLLVLAGGLGGCDSDPADELARLAPALPEPWLDALTAQDPSRFETFALDEGAGYLLMVETHLFHQLDTRSRGAFAASYRVLMPPLTRVCRVLDRDFGFETSWNGHQRFAALSMEEAFTCVRLFDDAYAITNDPQLDPAQKIRGVRTLLEELDRIEAPIDTSHLLLRIAEYHGVLGEHEAQRLALEECISADARMGSHRMTCQALGVLGVLVGAMGDEEGMLRYWNQGLELAEEHRLPEQSGRLMTFLANHYGQLGRLAVARELRRQANDLYQSYGGAPTGIRFLEDWLTLNAEMGCWDVVRRDLRGADPLLSRYAEWAGETFARDRIARIDHIRARAMLAEGKVEEANATLERVESVLMESKNYAALSRIQLCWAQGLLQEEDAAEALEVLKRGLLVVREPMVHASLLAEAARANAALGNWTACEEQLQAFNELMGGDRERMFAEWILHDALRIRLAFDLGDLEATSKATELACENLDQQLRSRDATSEAYLALREIQVLRDVLHELVSDRPRLGYELALEWRHVPSLLGAGPTRPSEALLPCESPLQRCAELVHRALMNGEARVAADSSTEISSHRAELPSGKRPRLCYRVGRRSLDRWSVVGDELIHESLDLPEAELRRLVGSILKQVGVDPLTPATEGPTVAKLPEELRAELYALARILLPARLFESASTTASSAPSDPQARPELLICLDGALSALPFGILNLSEDGYLPLIANHDPVYLWAAVHPDCATEPTGSRRPGVIVATPVPAAGSALWNSNLAPLAHGSIEARALHQWKPRSVLLEGETATKSALFAAWENAPFLYFACHMVRDADAPYISYLPLSLPPGPAGDDDSLGDSYLDAYDLGSVRLRGRPLVVLSACSSGAPYLVQGAQAPGLGEAFLRAGASTVIQTYWSVRDDVAARLMQEAMHAWAVEGVPPARALNAARRGMARDGDFTHPYYWGGTCIERREF